MDSVYQHVFQEPAEGEEAISLGRLLQRDTDDVERVPVNSLKHSVNLYAI
jgi:hypothetical protein